MMGLDQRRGRRGAGGSCCAWAGVPVSPRGFIVAPVVLALFLLLLAGALANVRHDAERGSAGAADAAGRKAAFVADDVTTDLGRSVWAFNYSKENYSLYFYDRLPAWYSVPTRLAAYAQFWNSSYRTADVSLAFVDPDGSEIDLGSLDPEIVINPFGMKYAYEDWGKRELRFTCPVENCSYLTRFDLNLTLENQTFDYAPTWGNRSQYSWSPDGMRSTCHDECLDFSLRVTDAAGQVYQCPGSEICDYDVTPLDRKSTLSLKSTPCWVTISFGSTGNPDEYQVFEIREHGPGGPSSPCSVGMKTDSVFTFNTTDYYINFPSGIRVRETTYGDTVTRVVSSPVGG